MVPAATQVLQRHPDTYFLLLGREHPSERMAGRLMKNIVDKVKESLPFCCHGTFHIVLGCRKPYLPGFF